MKKSKNLNGFTFIEVLITVAITGIVSLAIVGLQYIITQNQLVTFQNFLNIEEANAQITTLVREIRNIRPGENAAYSLERANDQELIFYSDIDYDGESEKVRYTLSGTQLVKGVIEPTDFPATYPSANEKVKVLTNNARNGGDAIFYYYNGDWPADTTTNPLPSPTRLSDSKLLRVYLKLNNKVDPQSDFILESYVQLRMLKQNL